jgi:hypothetical protein
MTHWQANNGALSNFISAKPFEVGEVWALPAESKLSIKGIALTAADLAKFIAQAGEPKTAGECWPWTAGKNPAGYGVVYIGASHLKGRKSMPVLATRLSWTFANRKTIAKGLLICHHCDNPQCINPHHLYAGTPKDNVHDAINRGRLNPYDIAQCPKAKGEASGKSKLTEAQVVEIRARYAAGGIPMKDLAAEFSVCRHTILGVLNGRVWSHVKAT